MESFLYGFASGLLVSLLVSLAFARLMRPRSFTDADLPTNLREYRQRKEIH